MVDDAKKLPHPEYPTRYERTPKMEQQIRKEIGDGIYPLLESHGFLRKNNHFARVFGSPQMLQVISIDYRHFFEPMICATIHPLYLFSACWKNFFRGINYGYEFAPGPTLEDIAGLRLFNDYLLNSYLRGQTSYGEAIEKEKQLLTDTILPLFDMAKDVESYLNCLAKMYPKLKTENGCIEDYWLLNRWDIIDTFLATRDLSKDTAFGWTWENPICDETGHYNEAAHQARLQSDWENFIKALRSHDDTSMHCWMNRSIEYAYENMRKYFATLAKKYPMQLIQQDIS